MNKEAIKLMKTYGDTIGSKPWIEAPVLGGVGAMAGYMGADLVVPRIVKLLMMGKSEQEKKDMMAEYNASDTLDLARKIMAGFGGIGGAAYGLQKHLDFSRGNEGLVDSFIQGRKYWDKPGSQKALKGKIDKRRSELEYTPSRTFDSGRSLKNFKQASYGMGLPSNFEHDRVPLAESLNLINEDPFLTLPQKEITEIVMEGAEGSNSGLTSGKALMRSAMRLGVGAATGYVFGRAASSLFALPSSITKRLSNTGALAGAVINSGIFSEIN